MFIKLNSRFGLCVSLAASVLLAGAAKAQTFQPPHSRQTQAVTREQLRSLMPDAPELQGFFRLQLLKFEPSKDTTGADSDSVELNRDVTQWFPGRAPTPKKSGYVSRIGRRYISANGLYWVTVEISLRATPQEAKEELDNFRAGSQETYRTGTFSGSSPVGDESRVAGNDTLLFRAGHMMVWVNGALTWAASHQTAGPGAAVPPFPTLALEAIAYQALLRGSQRPELSGVSLEQASVSVNSRALPKGAMEVAGRVYVPVKAFAQAMGLTTRWDTKTGALTLSGAGRKTVALTAGATAVTAGGAKAAALSVPVLKQAGQPVMTLDDLLAVTGGRVTGRSGSTVQVKT